MINQQQVDEILNKTKQIEEQIESNKRREKEISDKLIELNTKKSQILEELNKMGITEENLDSTIETLYSEVQNAIARFEESNK